MTSCHLRIAQKHLDFLVCDPHTLRPRLGIELDDSSHARPDRQARDAFVDQVFAAASLPLLHIPVHQGYAAAALQRQLEPYLTATAHALPSQTAACGP